MTVQSRSVVVVQGSVHPVVPKLSIDPSPVLQPSNQTRCHRNLTTVRSSKCACSVVVLDGLEVRSVFAPSLVPSESPSDEPSETPSDEPSETPSDEPSETPSDEPSDEPSISPSDEPSLTPSHPPSESLFPTVSNSTNVSSNICMQLDTLKVFVSPLFLFAALSRFLLRLHLLLPCAMKELSRYVRQDTKK